TAEPSMSLRAMGPEPTPAPGDTSAEEGESAASSLAMEETQPEVATSMADATLQPEPELPEFDTLEAPAELQYDVPDASASDTGGWSPWRIAEVGLAVVALITGLAALYLRFFRRV